MKKLITFCIFTIVLGACDQSPKPISYGNEACSHCKMQIMDNRFGAQVVTSKGKAIKFDAIECMINYTKGNEINGSKLYVTDYANPGSFIEAKTAHFLKSHKIPSPMGENLSAYSNLSDAKNAQQMYSGNLFLINELKYELGNVHSMTR